MASSPCGCSRTQAHERRRPPVKIEQVRIDAFGTLNGFDTGPEPLGQLVVVLGPNEAGKSTLFSFLTTASAARPVCSAVTPSNFDS